MSELRRDREWEHWPQDRRPEEGIRRKLRDLFHPTGDEDDVEQVIAVHSQELELRASQLAATVADLERREERTRDLRSAVEQMLRRGSAELDERHAELTELAARLSDREERLAEAEEALSERRRELGAVELRRAAVERREETLTEQERELDQRVEELDERERQLAELEERAADVEQREGELTQRAAELEALQGRVAETLGVVEREQRALAEREHALQEREADIEERARAVEDLERRERDVESAIDELRAREHSLAEDVAAVADQREELRQAVATVSRGLGLPHAGGAEPGGDQAEFVALVLADGRYRVVMRDDGPPVVGADVVVDGASYRIVRIGASPLPGDRRRCAFTEPVPAPPADA